MEEDSDCCPASACDQHLEEEYIDMEVSSSTTFFCYTIGSPPDSREFEFHMSSSPGEREPIPSPADELFYKGKLLPLHLPPRLQMVQRLLQNPSITASREKATGPDEGDITIATANTSSSTPFESCNNSPARSCCVSREMNPEEYYCFSAFLNQAILKKAWFKKLKVMRQFSLGLKLKASRQYLKSLFTRSMCSVGACAAKKPEECSSVEAGRRDPLGQIRRESYGSTETTTRITDREKVIQDEDSAHRSSFSGVIKHHLAENSSSTSPSSSCSSCSCSSSGANSVGHRDLPLLRRSSSVGSEAESSIQSAIAYCKKSQQLGSPRKSLGDDGWLTLSSSSIDAAGESKQSPGLCRG